MGWSISLVGTSRHRADGSWPDSEVVWNVHGGSQLLKWTPRELNFDAGMAPLRG